MSLEHQGVLRHAFAEESRFRTELYACLTARGDALFALYGGLNQGQIDVARLRRVLLATLLPRAADGRIVPAADVSPWLRPDASAC